jgi:hypothetical protein
MNYGQYRDQRLQQAAELAEAYAQENLERETGRQILRLRQMRWRTYLRSPEGVACPRAKSPRKPG